MRQSEWCAACIDAGEDSYIDDDGRMVSTCWHCVLKEDDDNEDRSD